MIKRQTPNTGKFADVPVRVRSWAVIIIIFSLALAHPTLTCLFVCLLTFTSVRELLAILCHTKGKKINLILFILAILEYHVLYSKNYNTFIIFVLFYIIIIILANTFLYRIKNITLNMQASLGIMLCTYSIAHLLYIYKLFSYSQHISGIKVLLLLVILTELNDVFQYLIGKTFGRHKITPKISPNKTVEGFVGGLISTTLVSNILGIILFPDKSLIIYSLIGILVGMLGFCGDIYMSSIKRKANVKDTSNLIPGHGGLLDRIDSLLFITPIYYWIIYLLYIRL